MDNKLYFIWNKSEKHQLSKSFNTSEFECKCKLDSCVEQRISKELIDKLQKLRDTLNTPIEITSGFRCLQHNTSIGGAKSSQHLLGNAADIKIKDLNKLLEKSQEVFDSVGDGRNKGFIHVDTRIDKKRLWTY